MRQRPARGVTRFFRQCRRYRVPFLWENPLTSIQWWTPAAQQVASWPHTQDVTVHYCAYGTRWRKPTKLRCHRLRSAHKLAATCQGRRICQYTGKPHIVLQGRDENNTNWTLRAQPYPPQLARRMADVFIDAAWQNEFVKQIATLAPRDKSNRLQAERAQA